MRRLGIVLVALAATGCISYHYSECAKCEADAKVRAEQEQRIADLEHDWITLRDAIETLQAATSLQIPSAYVFSTGRPSDAAEEVPIIAAKVLAVDEKLNVIVVSAGQADGVRVGTCFTIYRGDTYVGKVVVDSAQAKQCSGYSKKDLQAKPIEVGDGARTRW